jgi:hypothetical protein
LRQWHTEKNSCVLPDLICEPCGRFSSAFESVMGADLLLNVRSLLDETSDQWWYPHTLIYSASRVLPLFVRAEQSDQFRTLAHLLGGGNKPELEQRFLGRLGKQQRFGRLFASPSEGPVSLKTLICRQRLPFHRNIWPIAEMRVLYRFR